MGSAYFLQLALLMAVCMEVVDAVGSDTSWQTIETRLMRGYDRKHRPVKQASTTTNVTVLMMVNHIEEIDEREQTMLMHGVLWASWKDEYLKWNPSEFNNTSWIQITPWKIWQPALALYNSAKGNAWSLYMNGQPHGITSDGRVFATGLFSFEVTCGFDFSDFPNDEQTCPIVMADWVYDLSKVNLTNGFYTKASSIVRLSTNPFGGVEKKHVGGWEVLGSYEKVCYFGPNGCEKNYPDRPYPYLLDSYWSLIEFGVHIKRHAPYFMATIQLPIVVSAALALFSFWIDSANIAIGICLSAMLLEYFIGYSLMKILPPSTSQAPNIVYCYSLTFIIGLLILTFHVGLIFASNVLPENVELDIEWSMWSEWLRQKWPFKSEGLKFASFDPESLVRHTTPTKEEEEQIQGPHQTQHLNNPNFQFNQEDQNSFIEMDSIDVPAQFSPSKSGGSNNSLVNNLGSNIILDIEYPSTSAATSIIQLNDNEPENHAEESKTTQTKIVETKKLTHLEQELNTLRRVAFFVFSVIQIVTIIWFI